MGFGFWLFVMLLELTPRELDDIRWVNVRCSSPFLQTWMMNLTFLMIKHACDWLRTVKVRVRHWFQVDIPFWRGWNHKEQILLRALSPWQSDTICSVIILEIHKTMTFLAFHRNCLQKSQWTTFQGKFSAICLVSEILRSFRSPHWPWVHRVQANSD